MHTTTTCPSDIEACHRLLREQSVSIVEKDAALVARDSVIAECHTALAAKDALVARQNQQLVGQKDALAEMQLRLNNALQAPFRKRIERYAADPSRLKTDFGSSPEVADAAEGIADAVLEAVEGHSRREQQPVKARNEQLPAHLPRIEVLPPVPEDKRFCPRHGERVVIGHDWQERFEVVPARLDVVRRGNPKCACRRIATGICRCCS